MYSCSVQWRAGTVNTCQHLGLMHRRVGRLASQSHQLGTRIKSPKHVDGCGNSARALSSKPIAKHKAELERAKDISASAGPKTSVDMYITAEPRPPLTASRIPTSSIGRLFHYGNLAASLTAGVASEFIRRSSSSEDVPGPKPSLIMTEANITTLVEKLAKMRGAALKLGQFLSIQDAHVLPEEADRVFRRVQNRAHYMPNWQMEQVMSEDLGPNWKSNFTSFDPIPFAAASIGQVHAGFLSSSASSVAKDSAWGNPQDGAKVAIKVQFPNVAQSITSDLSSLSMLLTASRLLPRGLFLDNTIRVMSQELADECDYEREARFARAFGAPGGFLAIDSPSNQAHQFKVPWVWSGSTKRVLVMEYIEGVSVGGDEVQTLPQTTKDEIANAILELCLRELFEFRAMQTDPNWTNFLWDKDTHQIGLVDFGATRDYPKSFIDEWLRLLRAAIHGDDQECIDLSRRIGYLTGAENETMVNAHLRSLRLLAVPFQTSGPFSFSNQPGASSAQHWPTIVAEIRSLIPVMLKHRLTPPPRETLSLNRKLSGAFLLASRLEATVDCRSLWLKITDNYQFG